MATFDEIQALIQSDDIPVVVALLNYLRESRPKLFTSVQADYLIKRLQYVNDGSMTLDDLKQELIDAMSTATIKENTTLNDSMVIFSGSVYEYDDTNSLIPLLNAVIQIGNSVTLSDEQGQFNIKIPFDENISSFTYIASAENHISKTVIINTSDKYINLGNNILYSDVSSDALIDSYSGDVAGNLSIGDASISIIANGVIDTSGDIYSGNVNLYGKLLSPTSESFNDELPFELRTSNKILFSYGVIFIRLQDDDGNKLSLNGNDDAIIKIHIDDISNMPSTTPLWNFDENTHNWVEYGTATLDTNTNEYIGNISHSGIWSFNAYFDSTLVEFKLACNDNGNITQSLKVLYTFVDSANQQFSKSIVISDGSNAYLPIGQNITIVTESGDNLTTIEPLTVSNDVQQIIIDNISCVNYSTTFKLTDSYDTLITDDSTGFLYNGVLINSINDNTGTYNTNIPIVEPIESMYLNGSVIKLTTAESYVGLTRANDIIVDDVNKTIDFGTIKLEKDRQIPSYTIKDSNNDIIYETLLLPLGNLDETIVDNCISFIDKFSTLKTRTIINVIDNIDYTEWDSSIFKDNILDYPFKLSWTIDDDDGNTVELVNLNAKGETIVPIINTINTSISYYSLNLYGLSIPHDVGFKVNVLRPLHIGVHASGTTIQHIEFDVTYNNGTQDITIEVRI